LCASTISVDKKIRVSIPYGDEERIGIRREDITRILNKLKNIRETSSIFIRIADISGGVLITALFSLWQLWSQISDITKIIYGSIIGLSLILLFTSWLYENLINKNKVTDITSICKELNEYIDEKLAINSI
jgi:hypothetical protein